MPIEGSKLQTQLIKGTQNLNQQQQQQQHTQYITICGV